MYAKCGSARDALAAFDSMRDRNVVSWTTVVTAFAHAGHPTAALRLFQRMLAEGIAPNKVTFVAVLHACSDSRELLDPGRMIHRCCEESGLGRDRSVAISLANMYGKCGDVDTAASMLDEMFQPDVIAWSAVITGFAQQGRSSDALHLFRRMQHEGVIANKITLVATLSACTDSSSLADGKFLHSLIVEKKLESDVIVGGALVTMYTNCGSLDDARRAFGAVRRPNVIAWTAMISACVHFGELDEALQIFRLIEAQCLDDRELLLDGIVFVPLINACARLTDLSQGRRLHARISSDGSIKVDVQLGNALVNMYSKCGSVEEAARVFDGMKYRSTVSWNTMISAYAIAGHSEKVLWMFHRMQQEGVEPDEVSFVGVLSACNAAGTVEEGCKYFGLCCEEYRILLEPQHFGCLIDLLGRVGYLDEAERLLRRMKEPDVMAWMMLLDACRIHNDLTRAKAAAERVLELDPGNSAAYIMYTQSS
ncbi:hypothetical protein SELMODRAFT_120395 [Selaginella moellendorffii]|uniref:Pentacotripeptide-repeat region of PRORP domain-containing protein n=1 Tax=Selaginella moellendorffii TaxID=88036 RepID=D8SLY0_SELML|nr:hypothetical protein SELMODRAFT_120395 [Selaginella moellendorffii]